MMRDQLKGPANASNEFNIGATSSDEDARFENAKFVGEVPSPSNRESQGSSPSTPAERRRSDQQESGPRQEFCWDSTASQKLQSQIDRIATIDSTLLLLGESGTGKSTIARMVHERSRRRDHPFVVVNCASLPRDLIDAELFGHSKGAFTGAVEDRVGRVEMANGGTLFLDEIGDMPLELQPKLLTFLQDRSFYRLGSNQVRSVDVRVISATHADLLNRSNTGLFRRDLFFRLAVLRIDVPPLSQRREEIGAMAHQILGRVVRQGGISPRRLSTDAIHELERYNWPGNIRELENVIENAAAFCDSDVIQAHDLLVANAQLTHPSRCNHDADESDALLGKSLSEIEKAALISALVQSNGNKAQTARTLGISLRSVYNKMEKHGLVIDKLINTSN